MPIKEHFEYQTSEEIERRVKEIDLYSTTSVHALFAKRDPIFTPLFTAILGSGGVGLSGAALATGVAVASAIATTSLTQGLMRFP